MSSRRALSEGLLLSTLLVLAFASVNFLLSLVSASKRNADSPANSVLSTPTKPPPIVATAITLVPLAYKAMIYSFFVLAVPAIFLARVAYVLLEPLLFVIQITFDIFVSTPWKVISSAIAAFYPVYSFCAVACVIGLVLGWLAALAQQMIVFSVGGAAQNTAHASRRDPMRS